MKTSTSMGLCRQDQAPRPICCLRCNVSHVLSAFGAQSWLWLYHSNLMVSMRKYCGDRSRWELQSKKSPATISFLLMIEVYSVIHKGVIKRKRSVFFPLLSFNKRLSSSQTTLQYSSIWQRKAVQIIFLLDHEIYWKWGNHHKLDIVFCVNVNDMTQTWIWIWYQDSSWGQSNHHLTKSLKSAI